MRWRPQTDGDRSAHVDGATPQPALLTDRSVLLVDVSGSMDDRFQRTSKMDAAREVAQQLVNLRSLQAGQEAEAGQTPGLIRFDDTARVLAAPGESAESLQTLIGSLYPVGGTNIGAAIEVGLQVLLETGSGPGELLLLTDGLPQTGLSANEILAELAPRARFEGVVIHTIGFGQRGNVDEGFLAMLADATGGQYTFATTPFDLENKAVSTFHLAQGDPIARARARPRSSRTCPCTAASAPWT